MTENRALAETKDRYKFSFVMPVYKVEKYLEETVESVLSQTMSFKENVQIIFINDGSPDDSESICLRYQEKYPENIVYIRQENQGVSAARNAGIVKAQGKYISFLDSDDKISPDTLARVYDFFEENEEDVDVVSIKLEFFEAKTGPHQLNYKYDSTRVIDIEKEWSMVQLSGGSSFVKTSAIQGVYKFDRRLPVTEDATLLTEIILNKMKYGVVAEPVYFYRKRSEENSAISSSLRNKRWYMDTPKYGYQHLFDYSRKKLGYLPKYVQFLVTYDLQWRIKQEDQQVLSDEELAAYKGLIVNLIKQVDDEVIFAQNNIYSEHKLFLMEKKYGSQIVDSLYYSKKKFFIGEQRVYDYNWSFRFYIELCEIVGGNLILDGSLWAQLMPGVTLEFWADGKYYTPELVDRPEKDKLFLGEYIFRGVGFKVLIPIKTGMNVKAVFRYKQRTLQYLEFTTGPQSKLLDSLNDSYRSLNGYMICQPNTKAICVVEDGVVRRLKHEVKFLYKSYKKLFIERKMPLSLLFYRLVTVFLRVFKKKEIWLISDRVDAAGDNGEAIFRYINENKKSKSIRYYYAIKKSSPDYRKIKRIGRTVNRDSIFYKILFLQSDKIISSHADAFVYNAFGENEKFIRDLFMFDFVFLQHGVIHNDLSGWLSKYSKNIDLFITSANLEYKSILEGGYGYDRSVVKCTGMPRYDLLDSRPKNKIIVAPTWRSHLCKINDENERIYNQDFKNTDYYNFYERLLNDPAIISALKRTGGVIEFYLHPSHRSELKDFNFSAPVYKADFPYDYKKALSEGSLLITDYSSVAFDFAYMKKPVMYVQYDFKEFFEEHMHNKGYFSYDRDGFGPVAVDYDETVRAILHYIDKGYVMDKTYKRKVENFFRYNDKDNSQRVFDEIIQMGMHSS